MIKRRFEPSPRNQLGCIHWRGVSSGVAAAGMCPGEKGDPMRLSKTFKFIVPASAIAALSIAPAASAVTSNGKRVSVSVACSGASGTATPGGGSDGVYQDPYGNPYGGPNGPYGTPGSTPGTGCSGRVVLKAGKKTVGKGIFTLARGQRKSVAVRLTPGGRKALAATGQP